MARVSSGELWIESNDPVKFDGDGWVTVNVEPEGFKPLKVHLPPAIVSKLRTHRSDILQVITDETE